MWDIFKQLDVTKLRLTVILMLFLGLCNTVVRGQGFGVIRMGEAMHVGDSARVYLTLNPEMLAVGAKEVLTITPRLVARGDSVELPSVHILGRSAYYRFIRHDNLGLVMPGDKVIWEKRRWRPFAYLERTPWSSWMNDAVMKVQLQLTTCDEGDISTAQTMPVARRQTQQHKTAAMSMVQHRVITGRMTIIFPLDRTEIHPELYDNRRELDKIRKSIETVQNDADAQLDRVTIKGYASPEGPYDNNVRLARGRTDSIGAYVSRYFHLDKDKVHTEYEPEDWEGLVDYIRNATLEQLPHRDELLEIAARPLKPDQKEWLMRRRYPKDFQYLLDHCLPLLRHTDYRIDYNRREVVTLPGSSEPVGTAAVAMAVPEREGLYDPPRPYNALFALKTNVLFDLALAFNGEIEVPIGRNNRWSLMGEIWKPWYVWHKNSRAYQLQILGGEVRYWLGHCRERVPKLTGWFLGAYYAWGKYDFEWDTDNKRQGYNGVGDQGEFHSIGITAGYSWPIHRHWNLEVSASFGTLGGGWLGGERRHYHGEFGDTHLIWKYTTTSSYTGPTKLKVSLAWLIGRKCRDSRKEVHP